MAIITDHEMADTYLRLSSHEEDLCAELTEAFTELVFENRHSVHPRKLKELAQKEANAFLKHLSHLNEEAIKSRGIECLIDGVGERSILSMIEIFNHFIVNHLIETPTLLPKVLENCGKYCTFFLEGYIRQQGEEILLEQEQLRRALSAALESQRLELYIKEHAINTSISGILLTDLEGKINYANSAFLEIWDIDDFNLVIGKNWSDFFKPLNLNQVVKDRLDGTDKGWRGEYICHRRDGSRNEVDVSVSLIMDKKNHPMGIMASFVDVSDRRQAEREVRKLEEHLFQSQKIEAIGTMASGIAHDFNNILQAISGYIQLLEHRSELKPHTRVYLEEVDNAIERASDLVQRLLTFSRKAKAESRPIDINIEVDRAVSMLERTIPKMICIEKNLAPDRLIINGDPNQIGQLIMNLGANARDAMPHGGVFTIETRRVESGTGIPKPHIDLAKGDYIQLIVRDNGIGMDDETMSRIFEPFFTTKGIGEGTGLGLSSVYGIVKGHGGLITCHSEIGVGTRFDLFFPASAASDTADILSPKNDVKMPAGKEIILLVDDEKAVLKIAQEILDEYGYKTMTAESGEQALDLIQNRKHDFDLIILDLGMPGMGGQTCLQEILKILPEAKVIIASGYTSDKEIRKSLEHGATTFLRKPYKLTTLLQTVRTVLDKES